MSEMLFGGSLGILVAFLTGWGVWMLFEGQLMSPVAAWSEIVGGARRDVKRSIVLAVVYMVLGSGVVLGIVMTVISLAADNT